MTVSKSPVALITGAGQGIGRGIALRLAAEGFAVAVNDVVADPDADRGAYEVQRTIHAAGGAADVFKADVASPPDRLAMLQAVDQRFGRIDLLVNNAGVAPKERKDLLETSEESFERLIRINLQGPTFLTQEVGRRMIDWQKAGAIPRGRVVFISSISAYTSSPSRAEYCISKAGLAMAATLFAHRLGEHGIPVLQIAPGIIQTPMTAVVKDKYDRLIADGLLVTPRWGTPDDVARVVAAFARGDLDYSTGACIEIGGGFGIPRL